MYFVPFLPRGTIFVLAIYFLGQGSHLKWDLLSQEKLLLWKQIFCFVEPLRIGNERVASPGSSFIHLKTTNGWLGHLTKLQK